MFWVFFISEYELQLSFLGHSTTHQSLCTGVGEYYCICELHIELHIYGSRGHCVTADTLPHVMSLESALVGAEDYKTENEKNLGVWT